MPRILHATLLGTLLPLLSACAAIGSAWESAAKWTPGFLEPYRPDVHQGNVVTQEMVEQVRVGMSRDQVRFMLGTPLLTSTFHLDRWDYVYYLNRRSGEVQNRKLSVYFQDNRVAHFRSDPMPTETEADVMILGREALKKPKDAPRQAAPATMDQTTPLPGQQ